MLLSGIFVKERHHGQGEYLLHLSKGLAGRIGIEKCRHSCYIGA